MFRDLVKKKTVKNGIWMYILQFFNTIIPLLTMPYITRILGADDYGYFSISLNIVAYLQVIVEYGFGMSATRKMVLKSDKPYRDKLFTTVSLGRIVLLMCSVALTVVCILVNYKKVIQNICLVILDICLLGYCMQLNWLFQGMQEMKYISITNMIARSISVGLIFGYVKSKDDLFLYCLLYSISPVLSGIIGLVIARLKYNITFVKVDISDIFHELKDGFLVFTTQLSGKIFGSIGITFLGVFASASEVGIYSAIQKIPNVMILAWMPIAQVLYPISSQKMSVSFIEGKKFVTKARKLILPFFIISALLGSVFSRFLVAIAFGDEYEFCFYWMIPLLGWAVISINNNFLGNQILLGSGHDKEYSQCFQVGVLCTVVINLAFIYLWHGFGAAIAPLCSEGLLMIMEIYAVRKIQRDY